MSEMQKKIFLLQTDNEVFVSEIQKKKLGVTCLVSEINHADNYQANFEKLAHLFQLGLQGFIVEN